MLRYQTTARYEAQVGRIFPIVADFGRMEEWNPNVRSSTIVSGEPMELGTEVRCELQWPFPPGTVLDATLVEIDPPHRVTYSERTSLGRYKVGEAKDRIELEEVADGAFVTFETEAHLHSVFRVAELMPVSFYERQLARVAGGLRSLLDSNGE